MKAIHNTPMIIQFFVSAVNYTQRYKKWKQFTTVLLTLTIRPSCELYTKIQKMKAIHNVQPMDFTMSVAVNYTQRYKKWKQFTTTAFSMMTLKRLWTIHKDTKNESNSQRRLSLTLVSSRCELYTKIQKMKAIHNQGSGGVGELLAVNYTQRYKKWKQFTTCNPRFL